jgi:hypothetical protein
MHPRRPQIGPPARRCNHPQLYRSSNARAWQLVCLFWTLVRWRRDRCDGAPATNNRGSRCSTSTLTSHRALRLQLHQSRQHAKEAFARNGFRRSHRRRRLLCLDRYAYPGPFPVAQHMASHSAQLSALQERKIRPPTKCGRFRERHGTAAPTGK